MCRFMYETILSYLSSFRNHITSLASLLHRALQYYLEQLHQSALTPMHVLTVRLFLWVVQPNG